MTYKEAIYAVMAMTYDQTRIAAVKAEDATLKRVANWRLYEPREYRETCVAVSGAVKPIRRNNRGSWSDKRRATYAEVRARAMHGTD